MVALFKSIKELGPGIAEASRLGVSEASSFFSSIVFSLFIARWVASLPIRIVPA
ncbi:hypothetical protein [Sporotomaculum syntrophicum]|uniref:hypothetical protein n=1 Tax=Sporotomaculum syntrophicum TaxID=182264 RepID=UPI001379F563|nr:hypothetical protein [Sporotomaculum syntrophicum]